MVLSSKEAQWKQKHCVSSDGYAYMWEKSRALSISGIGLSAAVFVLTQGASVGMDAVCHVSLSL